MARAAARLSHAVAEALAAYSAAVPEVALVALATKWPGQTSKYVRAASPSPAAHPQLSLLRLRRGNEQEKLWGRKPPHPSTALQTLVVAALSPTASLGCGIFLVERAC